MNVQRLTRLRNQLKSLSSLRRSCARGQGPDGFDMSTWFSPHEEEGCGSTACALGWATFDKKNQEEGLILLGRGPVFVDRSLAHWDAATGETTVIAYKGYSAGARFYDISKDAAEALFSTVWYRPRELRDPAAVVKRINILLTHGEQALIDYRPHNTTGIG